MDAVTTKPGGALVPLEQVKALLRICGSEEDALLVGMVRTAEALCEAFIGRALIAREVEEALPARREWTRLALAPVRAILEVAALFEEGAASPLPVDAYAIDIDASGDGWVRVVEASGRVRVRYTAGQAADWNGIAEPLREGIARMAAHLYAHREGGEAAAVPAAVTALWRPWRRMRIAR
jgi:uncharacterized phiE125 gp8 family phage protein